MFCCVRTVIFPSVSLLKIDLDRKHHCEKSLTAALLSGSQHVAHRLHCAEIRIVSVIETKRAPKVFAQITVSVNCS